MSQKNEKPVISEDILLRPNENQRHILLRKAKAWATILFTLRILHWPLLIGGSIISLYAYSLEPTLIRTVILAIYGLIWLLKVFSLFQRRQYGIVEDSSGHPLESAIVQLTTDVEEAETHVLSTITDRYGRFIMIARPGIYEMTVAKEGYLPKQRSITAEETNLIVKLDATGINQRFSE